MKKVYLTFALLISVFFLHAQLIATTSDGRKVVLNQNGGWQYADSSFRQGPGGFGAGGGFGSYATASIQSMYSEAYDYAYEVIFGDEFFSSDRKTKAQQWAVQYVRDNTWLPIGYKSLEQWYDELYSFAYDNLYRNDFFSSDRKTKATEWAAQKMTKRAYFEDYRLSYFTRHRQAYNFAYSRIYRNEFFGQDRKRKALEWANAFVRR